MWTTINDKKKRDAAGAAGAGSVHGGVSCGATKFLHAAPSCAECGASDWVRCNSDERKWDSKARACVDAKEYGEAIARAFNNTLQGQMTHAYQGRHASIWHHVGNFPALMELFDSDFPGFAECTAAVM